MRIKQTYIPGGRRELWARPGRSCVDVTCENGDQRGLQAPASTSYQCKKVYLGQTEELLSFWPHITHELAFPPADCVSDLDLAVTEFCPRGRARAHSLASALRSVLTKCTGYMTF